MFLRSLITKSRKRNENQVFVRQPFDAGISWTLRTGGERTREEIRVQIRYRDEYGAKECQKTKVDVPGMGSVESATISKDGKTWSVNYTLNQVQEMDINPADQPNFLNLTDEAKKKFKIQEVGTEKVLDKDCTVYTLETEAQGMTAKLKVWVYKGFTMKTETEVMGMKIAAVATEFKEDAMVLPQVFDVPKL